MTISAPDMSDPNICMAADPQLSHSAALKLSAAQRGEILAKAPIAASKAFQCDTLTQGGVVV